MKKRSRFILFLIIITIVITGCGAKKDNVINQENGELNKTPQTKEEVMDHDTQVEETLLELIDLTYEVDPPYNDKQIATVWVKNESEKIFTGDIHIYFLNEGKKRIGYDMLIIEDLKPYSKQYAKIQMEPSKTINMEYNFSKEYSFIEDTIGDKGILQEDLSKTLTKDIYENFGGSGNEDFAASWYKNIVELAIYKDEDVYYSIVTVDTEDEISIERITMTVLANFKEVDLSKVITKDKNGDTLIERSK